MRSLKLSCITFSRSANCRRDSSRRFSSFLSWTAACQEKKRQKRKIGFPLRRARKCGGCGRRGILSSNTQSTRTLSLSLPPSPPPSLSLSLFLSLDVLIFSKKASHPKFMELQKSKSISFVPATAKLLPNESRAPSLSTSNPLAPHSQESPARPEKRR